MGPEWLQRIPESVKTVLLGAGGNFLGGLANAGAEALLGEIRQKVAKKFRADAEREAFNLALARAKYEAVALLTADPETMAGLLRVLAEWMAQEAVTEQLGRLVDPYPDSAVDTELLENALADTDLAARLNETGRSAKTVVHAFIRTFAREIENSDTLGRYLDTRLLRSMDAKLEEIRATVVPNLGRLKRRYLERICADTKTLNLKGLLEEASDATACGTDAPRLADIYIQLDTTAQREIKKGKKGRRATPPMDRLEEKHEPIPVVGAMAASPCMVLLGDPGSGKSTFVNHLSLCLSAQCLDPSAGWLARLPEWPEKWAGLLPIPVELRAFAAWVRDTKPTGEKAGLLSAYLEFWMKQRTMDDAFRPVVIESLRENKALLLLDGLDEIQATGDVLDTVKACIEDLPKAFGEGIPILATCRVLSYQDKRWQLGRNWPTFELAKLSRKKIKTFIDAWYAETGPGRERVSGRDRLVQATAHADLAVLAENPLLLTMMAVVNDHKGGLPDTRAILYEEIVDLLLKRWDATRFEDGKYAGKTWQQMVSSAGVKDIDVKAVLWEVAYDTHAQSRENGEENTTADIPEASLVRKFKALHPDFRRDPDSPETLVWADALCRLIKMRAGLLIENPAGVYRFPHRTFQEFLAGCHLNALGFTDQALNLCREDTFWWNAALLAIGRMVHQGNLIHEPLALIDRLCPENGVKAPNEEPAPPWPDIWFAGKCLMEVGPDRVRQRRPDSRIIQRVRDGLKNLVTAGALTPVERADAGRILGILGDDRRGVGCFDDGTPEIDWRRIEPGLFYMGSKEGEDEGAWEDEFPGFECRLINQPYRISRHAVTVAQYRPFIDEGGYGRKEFWTPAGWKWRQDEGVAGPATYSEVFQTPNHPQVGVSWYEADAYCRWLSRKTGREILLPTEPQWERAARHTDGRSYPWGTDFDAALCNCFETGIGQTSAVGLFPGGNAECGAADMAGNVLEWCRTLWRENYQDYESQVSDDLEEGDPRVVRGGAFDLDRRFVRCAYRDGDGPNLRLNFIGFRVVSPGL